MDGINLPITKREKSVFLSPMTSQIMSQLTAVVSKNKDLSGQAQVALACKSSYGNMSYPFFNYIQRMEFLLQKNDDRDHFYAMQYLIDCQSVIQDNSEFRVMCDQDPEIQRKWLAAKTSINGLVNRVRAWGFQKDPTEKITWGAFLQASQKMNEEEGNTAVMVRYLNTILTEVRTVWAIVYDEFIKVRHILERSTNSWEALKIEYVKNVDRNAWRQYDDFVSLTVNVKTGKIWRYVKNGYAMWAKEGDKRQWERSIGWGNKDKAHMTIFWSRNMTPHKIDLSCMLKPDYSQLDRELSECMEGSSI